MSCTPSRPFPPPRPPGYRPSPCPPPKPCRGGRESALLPKVAAWERCRLPCLSTDLRLESLPCSAEGPCRLLMVQQSGAPPWWEPAEQPCGEQRLHIRVCIPVCCQVMDACERLVQRVRRSEGGCGAAAMLPALGMLAVSAVVYPLCTASGYGMLR